MRREFRATRWAGLPSRSCHGRPGFTGCGVGTLAPSGWLDGAPPAGAAVGARGRCPAGGGPTRMHRGDHSTTLLLGENR